MEQGGEGITLYWNIVSQPSRSVKALLLAGNVPHKDVSINIMAQEQKGEEFTKVNPRQLVPFIKDGDFGLSESNAILKYLSDTQPSIPESYWPKDLKERYKVDQFLEYYQFHFRPAILAPLRTRIGQKMAGMKIPQDVLELIAQQQTQTLETFEKLLTQYDTTYVATNDVTIADLQLFFEITNMHLLKESFDQYPAIKAWFDNVSKHEVVAKVQEQWSAVTTPIVGILNRPDEEPAKE
eukprot:403343567